MANKTIWKFPLKTIDQQFIEMPVGAEILSIQSQNNYPCLWALVDRNAKRENISIEIYGTGHPHTCWKPKIHWNFPNIQWRLSFSRLRNQPLKSNNLNID